MTLEERARVFAVAAHSAVGQLRKYTHEPYWVHPAEVVKILKTMPHTPQMVAAAWLHDTVEDTGVTLELVRAEFGDEVADIVGWLTDVSKPSDGNRETRKAMDRAHIAQAPREAQIVKLADLISNTQSITQHDPDFAKVYLKEKFMTLDVLDKVDKDLIQAVKVRDTQLMNYLLHGTNI